MSIGEKWNARFFIMLSSMLLLSESWQISVKLTKLKVPKEYEKFDAARATGEMPILKIAARKPLKKCFSGT
jgi:hypothetical protein